MIFLMSYLVYGEVGMRFIILGIDITISFTRKVVINSVV